MASQESPLASASEQPNTKKSRFAGWFGKRMPKISAPEAENNDSYRPKATLGILSDKETDEVPGEWLNQAGDSGWQW